MPYLIAARVELGTRTVGRVGRARLTLSVDGLAVHVLDRSLALATIQRNSDGKVAAWTYRLEPVPGSALDGVHLGPYPDLSAIKNAIEIHTCDACAISISAPTVGSRRPKAIRGVTAEISFDTDVSESGQNHVEGSYRIFRRPWQVFYFTSCWQGRVWKGPSLINANCVWQSGITGVQVVCENTLIINKAFVRKTLSEVLGVNRWSEVLGPDSLELK